MQQQENIHYNLAIAFVALCLWLSHAQAYALNFLNCNGQAAEFEEGTLPWNIDDAKGNGVVWRECSQAENFTGEAGKSLCVTPLGLDYDTTATTQNINLKGAITAEARFTLYYQDSHVFKDRFTVEARIGAGAWNMIFTEEFNDWGLPGGPGIEVILNLAAYVGNDDVELRFRYWDQSNSGEGDEVQIDNVRLLCTGGADMESDLTSSVESAIEGKIVDFDLTVTNNGSGSATDVIGITSFPAPFSVLDVTGIPLGSMEFVEVHQVAFGPPVPLGNGSSIGPVSSEVRIGMYPEVTLNVQSPAFLAGSYDAVGATYGPEFDANTPLNGVIVLAVDGMGGNHHDGCDPLTNADEIAGNIAFLHDVNCSKDIAVKNAQDAGAIAAIVGTSEVSPIDKMQYPNAPFGPLRPSGMVLQPITIPALRISPEASDTFKLNIAASIDVAIQGVEIVEQELGAISYTFAEEFDPDFNIFSLLFGDFSMSNNFDVHTIRVLRDRDGDGSADINDGCIEDSAKTAPGICGCGVADTDNNGDGVIDCEEIAQEVNAEAIIKLSVSELLGAVKKLKPLLKNSSKKKKQKARAAKKLAKQLLAELEANVNTQGAFVVLANPADNLDTLLKAVRKKVKKALRISNSNFKQNKRRAKKRVQKMENALA